MMAIPFHPVLIVPQHLSGLGPDDFICFGLIALVLVIATFVVRGGEKKHDETSTPAEPQHSVEK